MEREKAIKLLVAAVRALPDSSTTSMNDDDMDELLHLCDVIVPVKSKAQLVGLGGSESVCGCDGCKNVPNLIVGLSSGDTLEVCQNHVPKSVKLGEYFDWDG